jgi:hypothetical protein
MVQAKLNQYDALEQKVQHMQATHANAVVAEGLINQMLAAGAIQQNADGDFVVLGPDGQRQSFRPDEGQ